MTVEEFLKSKSIDSNNYAIHDITNNYLPQIPIGEWLREFAAYHVEKALRKASEEARIIKVGDFGSYPIQQNYNHRIDKDSILNSYPLDNIK